MERFAGRSGWVLRARSTDEQTRWLVGYFCPPFGRAHGLQSDLYPHGWGGRLDKEENAMDIRLGEYKICNGKNREIDLALHTMAQANMGLGVLFDRKLTGGIYTCYSPGYNVLAS